MNLTPNPPTAPLDLDLVLEVIGHEALIRQAYKDSEGVWTWSVGLTNGSGHNVERYIGKPQPLQHCIDVFVWALRRYAAEVDAAFAPLKLTKFQRAAAVSFHWNTGAIGRASWVKKFKAGDVAGARRAFMAYNKPASIIGRRAKERDLFFDGKWSNDGTCTEFTRLTKNHTPDWSSGVKINVRAELTRALNANPEPAPVRLPPPPPPPYPPPPPDIEDVPNVGPRPVRMGFWTAVWLVLKSLVSLFKRS